jgi:hypothetical protein
LERAIYPLWPVQITATEHGPSNHAERSNREDYHELQKDVRKRFAIGPLLRAKAYVYTE